MVIDGLRIPKYSLFNLAPAVMGINTRVRRGGGVEAGTNDAFSKRGANPSRQDARDPQPGDHAGPHDPRLPPPRDCGPFRRGDPYASTARHGDAPGKWLHLAEGTQKGEGRGERLGPEDLMTMIMPVWQPCSLRSDPKASSCPKGHQALTVDLPNLMRCRCLTP
ncbi:hypothetical protein PG984_001395 [Apiospora sp. TS-2023a]